MRILICAARARRIAGGGRTPESGDRSRQALSKITNADGCTRCIGISDVGGRAPDHAAGAHRN
ncbi:MAG: hypothetical protein KDB80_03540, partial [Planctomycetes bacterium]|nr:hypothetical protein [Planctomycetota bacterium]